MDAQELYEAGRLREAVETQTQVVKRAPADADARFLLFTLLAFSGELERAGRQLQALGSTDPATQSGLQVYLKLLESEGERRAVLAGDGRPLLPPDPPADVEPRLRALAAGREGDAAAAERALEEAAELADTAGGKLNGESFEAIRDTDDVLAPLLEVYAGGRYLWLPFTQIRRLEVPAPQNLLDLLWVPATLEDIRGTEASVHLPVLYDGSHAEASEPLRLGRVTEWRAGALGDRGVGQRVLLTVEGDAERETSLLDVRRIEIGSGG